MCRLGGQAEMFAPAKCLFPPFFNEQTKLPRGTRFKQTPSLITSFVAAVYSFFLHFSVFEIIHNEKMTIFLSDL